MSDIRNQEDIRQLVDEFYSKVKEDDLLGPIFEERIAGNWAPHLEKMYSFWGTVLLEESSYRGSPFPPHSRLPVDRQHFKRWLQLFHETINTRFAGPKAEEAKLRAGKMAQMFEIKIDYYRKNGSGGLV